MLLALSATAWGRNEEERVTKVSEERSLITPVDLVITDKEEALTGSIDIANENAAVIFANANPTTVIDKYLSRITIHGEAAKHNENCRVAIYGHGSIVLPHGRTFAALTVYTEKGFGGESRTFSPGGRQVLSGTWNNSIQSIRLKRGYMATLANHADGTGYSHCYIADREDIEIDLRKEQAGRTTMLRVFKWNWPTKKGCSDARDENMMNTCKATWYYDWGAGRTQRTNHEYVPQRHHEAGESNGQGWKGAWESWDNINAGDETCTHVLGQNEPDNTSGAGEVYTYVTKIPDNPREKHAASTLADHAKEFLYSGKRVGTFACCNPNTGWVKEYVDYCRENNIRIDFVATHYYIGGQSPQGCIDRLWSLYNATGLPVWVTEWNNGANWSGESGFSTDAGWYTWGTGNDNAKNGEWLRDVLRRADKPENTKWLERLAVYNAVEGRREIFTNGQITAGGKIWGAYESDLAYDSDKGSINYFMPWKHHAPHSLEATLNKRTQTVELKWTNPNSDMTDYAVIEQKEGTKWVALDTIPLSEKEEMTYTLDVADYAPAMYELRVKNYEYDGTTHTTDETTTFTLSAARSVGLVQYGQLQIGDTETVQTDIEEYDKAPYVFTGMISNNNAANGISSQLVTTGKSSFKFRFNPWKLTTPVDFNKSENVDYLVLPSDTVIHLPSDMMLITATAGRVKGDEVKVTFPEPYPVGVTPIVVAQQTSSSTTLPPVVVKVWNVTHEGFSIKLMRQEGTTGAFSTQTVNYVACTPGQVSLGGGKLLTVGSDPETPVYGTTNKKVRFLNTANEEIALDNPYIIAAPQTHNYPATSVFRMGNATSTDKTEEGFIKSRNIKRQMDATTTVTDKNNSETGDVVGYLIISNDPNGSTSDPPLVTAIRDIELQKTNEFCVSTAGGRITCDAEGVEAFNAAGQKVAIGQPLAPGIYVVTNGHRSTKVIIR